MSHERITQAVAQREQATRDQLRATIELQQACIELHQQGYSGYKIAQLAGVTKMTVYKWVSKKTS
jgi:transposase